MRYSLTRPVVPFALLGSAALLVAPVHSVAGTIPSTLMARALGVPGEQLWVKRYPPPAVMGSYSAAYSMGVSPDGTRVFVTGQSSDHYATIAYDTQSGTELWVARYLTNGGAARRMAVSPDGSKVFVTGEASGFGGTADYTTIAYDASTGAMLWVEQYDGGQGTDLARAIGVSPDGSTVFVSGASQSQGLSSQYDYATIAYDAATGDTKWVERLTSGGRGDDDAFSLGASPDGSKVFVTGNIAATKGDYGTVAYDASTGHMLWEETYNGPGNGDDLARSIGVSPDGSKVFVTGASEGPGTGFDYATIAYDAATGTLLWVERYNGPENQPRDMAAWLGVSPDGSKVFVTGTSGNLNVDEVDIATVAYNASSGTQLWVKRYTGPKAGSAKRGSGATSLAVSPDGFNVYVTGVTQGMGGPGDYATIAYDASTGNMLWVERYNGPGNNTDLAHSVGVSPDGSKVFVTGESQGLGSRDYATIAYGTR